MWWLVGVPLVAGTALLISGRDRFAPHAGIATAVVTLALAITVAFTHPTAGALLLQGLPIGLAVDGLSATLIVTVATVLLAVLVFAAGELREARFNGLMLIFVGAMLVTVTATNLVTLLMAWEVMGATSYALIGYWWRERERPQSGLIAFLTTRAGDVGLYVAAGAAFAAGKSNLADLATVDTPWRDVVAAGVLVAAIGKSAQLPFSFWLSKAMAGPSPVSALLHSATMVAAGAYLLLRVDLHGWAATTAAWIGALTALALGAVAVAQRDLKQLLAASTCSQIGYMVLAAGTGDVAAGTGQLVAHAATKSLLFLGAGAWLTALGTKDLAELRGAARRYPLLGITFTIGGLSLAGVPPFSIWVTKDAVLSSALATSIPLYLVGLAAAVVSGLYVGRALGFVWARNGIEGRPVSTISLLPLPVLAAASAVLGFILWPSSPWWELALTGVLAVASVLVAQRIKAPQALANWLGLETAVNAVIVKPTLKLANGLARFDDKVVDGGVRATAAIGSTVARLVNARIEFSVDAVVATIGQWAKKLGAVARRPQTGQLHQYYAQAVVVLFVLAVLLMIVR